MMRFQSVGRQLFERYAGNKKDETEALLDAIRSVFVMSDEGQVIMLHLMRLANMDLAAYEQSMSADQYAFIEGKRAVVHELLRLANMTEIDMLDRNKEQKKNGG